MIPGALDTPTGGYGYDRRLMAELGLRGWEVRHVPLAGGWPFPDAAARAGGGARRWRRCRTARWCWSTGWPAGRWPAELGAEAARLRLVALVHHPLGDESGLGEARAAALLAAEAAALGHARAVVCTSAATGRRLADFGVEAERITVAPPGTEPAARAACGGGSAA